MAKKTKKPVKKAPAKKVAAKPKAKAKPVKKAAAKKTAAKKAPKKVTPKKAVKKSASVKKSVKAKPVKKATAKKVVAKVSVAKVGTARPTVKVDYTKAITPLGDRLVIRLVKTEKVSPAGLILPDSMSSTEGYLKGEVLAAGHGTYTKKGHHKLLDVKIGDVVLFNEYSSTKVKFNNEDLHIVHENEILGVTE